MSSKKSLAKQLELKRAQEDYEARIIGALSIRYGFGDRAEMVGRESAGGGHLYSYLAMVLGEKDSWRFKRKIREILLRYKLVRIVRSMGTIWFCGVKGIREDQVLAHKQLEQHYEDRKRYKRRQREFQKRRQVY